MTLLHYNHNALAQVVTDDAPKYEMRGAWIASVMNIDWPSKKGLPVEQQKEEYINMISSLKRIGINAVFVQIRPSSDAFYPSQYDPWSEYLTGTQGKAPDPYYDPMLFMIEETHKLGMEFHAWINPYRAVFDINHSSIAANHVTKVHPEWFVTYGKNKIFNPGLPESVRYIVGVVKDILNRYDIDGIHMDDYFYPYPIQGIKFNDADAYKKYGHGLSLADWRRSNCDSIIKAIHDAVLEVNPMISFGVSPFGIYRNKRDDPDGSNTAGSSDYDDLYANITLWLKNGWIDYVAPQLYWEIGHRVADYKTLIEWWSRHTYGRHLYIGEGVYRPFESPTNAWRNPNEIPRHIQLSRSLSENVQGNMYFSSKSILNNPNGWADSLEYHYYAKPALIPPMTWIDNTPLLEPEIWATSSLAIQSLQLKAVISQKPNGENLKAYAVYISKNDLPKDDQAPEYVIPATKAEDATDIMINITDLNRFRADKLYIEVTAIDRENNESDRSNLLILEKLPLKGWRVKTR